MHPKRVNELNVQEKSGVFDSIERNYNNKIYYSDIKSTL